MATQQLSVMVKNLRSEAGHALSIAQGTNQYETLKYLLARTQEELWTAFAWPELASRADVALLPGQYNYNFPITPVVTYDMVKQALATSSPGSDWHELAFGIPEDLIEPVTFDNVSRADPVQAWDVFGTNFRVYPTPDAAGNYLRFKTQRALDPFIADNHTSTLDATVITLFAAAELLSRAKAEDAAGKMQKAQRHLTKLLGNKITSKMRVSSLGGGAPVPYSRTNRNLLWQS